MSTDTNDTDNADGTNSTNTTLAETVGVVRGSLERLEDDQDDRDCEARVDETGRFWLEDPENTDEAYLWTRTTIDVEAVR